MTTNEPPPYPGEPNPSANNPQSPPPLPSYGSVQPPEGSYPPPPPGGYPPPAPGGYGGAPQQNKKALWSMILGIVGLICCGIFAGIPALILATLAKGEIRASGGTQTGQGMATAGFWMGIVSIVFSVIYVILLATGTIDFSATA